ncbi:putative leucine-rich repeat-containing protein DDB_G0290503 [Hydractinia symbiolongicarpus]|uniref:putative leucine-rich repeat-containing protein DDB_G0290503 n=1 Tax=Hydractinia symbiolongicarpus TaxID=13093 RepID=UPI00254A190C|nr:putative leucine-rich repeat-containing protein DDB_G0290503 [Hydractinia symbiolongicarpus]
MTDDSVHAKRRFHIYILPPKHNIVWKIHVILDRTSVCKLFIFRLVRKRIATDSTELNDVNKRLAKDGMRRDMSIEHKLRYVWRLFQRSESSLKSAVEDVADLQRQQGKDMLEVENYVSHIRKLSDEQKRLTCDYEVENTELKEKIALLKEENLSFSRISDKVTRLLREQDIPEELFTTNTEVQIEYLLNKNRELQSEFSEKFKSLEQENVSTKQILLHISHIADLQSKELKPDLIKEKIAELINSNKKLENENILVKNKITDLSNKGKKTQDILNDIECLFKHSVPNMTQSSLKENIEFVLEENKVLVSELKIKEKELHDYQTEYVKNNTKAFKDMQEENFRLMQKVAMLEEEKSNFKSEIKKKEVLIQNTSKDNHLASKQLQILQEKLKAEKVKHDLELEDMAKSYENELDNTVRNHQTEITNMEEEKNRYNKLIVDLRNMRAKANFLEKDNNLLKQEIKALEIENKSFQNDLVNIKEEQKGLLVKLKKEHEELLSERTTKHSLEVQKLHEQTAARINDYEILKVKNEDNCQQRKALKQRLIYASIELKELKERVHTLTDKNKKVENGLQLEKENSRKYLKRFKELTAVKRHLKVKVKTLNEMLTMQTRLLEKTKTTLLQTEKEVKNKDILYAHMRQNDTNQVGVV